MIKNTDSNEEIKEKLILLAVTILGMIIFALAGAGEYSFFGGMSAMFAVIIYWKKTGKVGGDHE